MPRNVLQGGCAAVLLAAATAGQSINVDFGSQHPAPDPNFAAAGAAGPWLKLQGHVPAYALTADPNVDPNTPGVPSLHFNLPLGPAFFDHPETSGGSERMLDDYFDLRSVPIQMELRGLQPGRYRVLTYAWAPDDDRFSTFVTVGDDSQQIGGVWPGGLQTPIVYALQETLVQPGEDLVVHLFGLTKGTLNAFQLVLLTPLCAADVSGDGVVDLDDLLIVLGDFGCDLEESCTGDADGDDDTDLDDLLLVLGFFGAAC